MNSFISTLLDEEIYSTHFLFETTQEFVERMTSIVMHEYKIYNNYVGNPEQVGLAEELRLEISVVVLKFLRIKTYGHYDLLSFRRQLIKLSK